MKGITKFGIVIGLGGIAACLAFYTIPLKQWKKYKAEHPSLFEIQDEATPTYWNFVKSYWKTLGMVLTDKEEDITYDGGELPEIVITPNKD
jgi:hypothetical protein